MKNNRISLARCLFFLWLLCIQALSHAAISVVDGFDPNANGPVKAMAYQPDGKVVLCGYFTTVGGQARNHIARINADGSLDSTFAPAVSGDVYTLALQPDGKIVIAGYFTAVAGQNRMNIARLNANGSLDTSFNPGVDNEVFALAVQPDGKILVGGWFNQLGGQSRLNIGRLNADGTLDSSFNPTAGHEIYSFALQGDGKILVGGSFSTLGGQTRNRIGRLNPDGTLDQTFNPGANGTVRAIATQPDGRIIFGGTFTILAGQPAGRLGRTNLDGSPDPAFAADANDAVMAVVVQADGKMVAGGYFTSLNGQPSSRIARLHPDGSVDSAFTASADSNLNALVLQGDGRIVAGGNFSTLSGQTRNCIGRLYPDGFADATLNPGANNSVSTTSIQSDGKIVAGGGFTTLAGQTRNYLGRLNNDGSLDLSFNPDPDNIVAAVSFQGDDKLVAGGYFTKMGGQARNRIARLNPDGSLDTTFNPGAGAGDGGVTAVAVQRDGKIVVAGTFTTLGGVSRNYLGRLNADGSLDTAFNPAVGGYSTVKAVAIQPDGKIIVGGVFTSVGGYTRSNICRLNADGSVDLSFNPGANAEVDAIALQPDGKIVVGGSFTTLAGASRSRIGRLSAGGSIDNTFNPGTGADNSVLSIAIQANGKMLLGGKFVQLGGGIWKSIGRLNADGTVDTTFPSPGVNGPVNSLSLQSDGKVIIGGTFTTFNVLPRNNIGRQDGNETSSQDLKINVSEKKATWMRSGSTPELSTVTFDLSADRQTWSPFNDATRITGGWSATAPALSGSGTFYVRARGYAVSGQNNGGTSVHESVVYYAPPAPLVTTGTASSVTANSCTVSGTVNPNDAEVSASFEYGTTTAYGATATAGENPLTGNTLSAVTASLTPLLPNTTYHFRAVATNGTATVYGADATFTTPAPPAANLAVIVSGTGSGTVHTAPDEDLGCASGTCNKSYPWGSTVTLTAAPGVDSYLVGWTGCDALLNGECSVTITGDRTVTALFDYDWPIVIGIPGVGYLGGIQGAYDSLSGETKLLRLKVRDFSGDLNCNRNIDVILQGGCSADLSDCSGRSNLGGKLSISDGSVAIGNISFK